MKISTAFRDAFRVYSAHIGDTVKFLLTELCVTLMCLTPALFLMEKSLQYLALIAVPLCILILVPMRVNAASALQDSLGDGRLFSLCRHRFR